MVTGKSSRNILKASEKWKMLNCRNNARIKRNWVLYVYMFRKYPQKSDNLKEEGNVIKQSGEVYDSSLIDAKISTNDFLNAITSVPFKLKDFQLII